METAPPPVFVDGRDPLADLDVEAMRRDLEVVRRQVEQGTPVFLIKRAAWNPKARPPTDWQWSRADPRVLDAWEPGDAVCLVGGHNYDFIDWDAKKDPNGEGYARLKAEVLDHTDVYAEVKSVNDGRHYWAKSVQEGKHQDLYGCVDLVGGHRSYPEGATKTSRGFLYAPPTIRYRKSDGKLARYEWVTTPPERTFNETYDVDPGSEALRRAVRDYTNRGGKTRQRADGTVTDWTDPDIDALLDGVIPEGQSHERTMRDVVWRLVQRGEGDKVIDTIYFAIASAIGLKDPGWEWTDEDLKRHLDGARAELGKPPGGDAYVEWARALAGDVVDDREVIIGRLLDQGEYAKRALNLEFDHAYRLRIKEREQAPVGERAERLPQLDWAGAVERFRAAPPTDFILGKLLERGQQVSMVGSGKVGKSFWCWDWCGRAVLGLPFVGDDPRPPLRVLYLDRENNERDLVRGMLSLGFDPMKFEDRFSYRLFPELAGALNRSPAAARDVLETVEETGAELVVLDTVSRYIEGSENDSETWLSLYRLLHEELKSRGVACVRLDHLGKDSDKGSRGSSAKSQDVDHVWELTKTGELDESEAGPLGVTQTVTTALRWSRTHTRTGIGPDSLHVTRVGVKQQDVWLEGRSSHDLADLSAHSKMARATNKVAQALIDAGAPTNLGRDKLRAWAEKEGIAVPSNNGEMSAITAIIKASR